MRDEHPTGALERTGEGGAVPPAVNDASRPASPAEDFAKGTERACSVARTINILSDVWAFLIMREAFFGARNFEAFQARLGIPRQTLAERLAALVAQGVFRKVASKTDRRRHEYRLTEAGLDLYPVFIALMQFGDRWLSEHGPPLTLLHEACGHVSHPRVACSECLEEVTARDVAYEDGPGAGRETSPAGRSARRRSDDTGFLVGRPSAVARTLQVIGDRWSFMVVREAFFGVRRYEHIQSNLNIASNILTDRLARFVARGIFERRLYRRGPDRHEYVLTPMGRDLYGPFVAMLAWGDRWLSDGRPPLLLTHHRCGRRFTPVVVCDRCRGPVHAADMRYRPNYDAARFGGLGPGAVK